MIYSQELGDINFAEPFLPIQQVELSFECSDAFQVIPDTQRGQIRTNRAAESFARVTFIHFFYLFLGRVVKEFSFQPRKDSGAEGPTVHVLLFRLLPDCC